MVSSNEDAHKEAKGQGQKSQGDRKSQGDWKLQQPLTERQTGNRKQSGKSGPEAAYFASFLGLRLGFSRVSILPADSFYFAYLWLGLPRLAFIWQEDLPAVTQDQL